MKISECAQLFLSYIEDKSPHTVKNYKIDLKQFQEILKDKDVENITKADIAKFRMYLQAKKLKNSSIARKIASINTFFKYLIDMDLLETSPITKSHRPKISNKIPEALTHEEVQKLINESDNLMDKVLILFLVSTGLRASEVLGIHRQDIIIERDKSLYTIDSLLHDINESDIAFIKVQGKGNKERLVPITGKTLTIFAEYLKKHTFDKVFPLSYISLWKRIKSLGKKLNLELHPHKLRHTSATLALQSGAELRVIQQLLGHSSPTTTARYTKVNKEQLVKTTKDITKWLND